LGSRTAAGWQAAYDAWNVTIPDVPMTRNYFYEVGLDITEDGYRRVVHEETAHLLLPHGYLAKSSDHPTWSLDTPVVGQGRFGRSSEAPCAVCGGTLHRLVAFDKKPSEMDLPDEIVTCQSCLGWSEEVLFFAHESGVVRPAPVPVTTQEPQFPTEPIPETTLVFRETPDRWLLQSWHDGDNLNRLGGEPTWDYPQCPQCGVTMTFIFQLDSLDIVDAPRGACFWGSGSLLYAFWCSQCSWSATRWQYT